MKREPEERHSDALEGSPKPSDQLPEEAPAGQVVDDRPEAGEGAAREAALRHVRRAGGGGRGRGESPAAGGDRDGV